MLVNYAVISVYNLPKWSLALERSEIIANASILTQNGLEHYRHKGIFIFFFTIVPVCQISVSFALLLAVFELQFLRKFLKFSEHFLGFHTNLNNVTG